MGVVVGKGGRDIPLDKALSHVGGWLLCLDMTWRDEQDKAKKEGLPWCVAKGADTFAAVSHKVLPASAIQNPGDVEVWLKVNGKERQRGNTSLMLFPIPQLISHISSIFTLEEGDIIMTGTPKGVGPVGAGDVITAGMNVGRNGNAFSFPSPALALLHLLFSVSSHPPPLPLDPSICYSCCIQVSERSFVK